MEMKKIIIFISIFISLIYLSSAVDIVLNSGQKLDNSNWTNLSSILNKVDISWSNLNINWKLSVNWKICANDLCLWDNPWTQETPWKSCSDLLSKWVNTNWVYYIKPTWYSWSAFQVYCDMKTEWWGWTRYVNISWNYSFTSAKHCWYNSNWINKNAYGWMTECFNPNRYGMWADKLRLKIWWTNYVKSITNWASVTTNTYSSSWGRYCLWHVNYMTMRDRPSVNYPNADSVWLWASACTPSSTPRQVWWIAGSQYMNTTETSFWPPNAWWSGAADTTTELYIR